MQMDFTPRPVTGHDGTVYPSRSAAARAYGVTPETIRWNLAKYGDLSMVGTFRVPVTHKGVKYKSMAEFGRKVGINGNTVASHLDTHGHLMRAGKGCRRNGRGNRHRCKPITIAGETWPSRKEAAKALGLSISWFSVMAGPKGSAAQRARLALLVMRYRAAKESAAMRKANRG
jgi:hypothetical protein